ncbi:MAG: hypothetical protein K6360_01330 [Deltaproteobacteria bacterium]
MKLNTKEMDSFKEDISKEILRVNRYRTCTSGVLMEIEQSTQDGLKDEGMLHFLKGLLRASDCVFLLGEGRYGAILPFTHEAGGEITMQRVKEECMKWKDPNGLPPASVAASVVCLQPHEYMDASEVITTLERELALEKEGELEPFSPHITFSSGEPHAVVIVFSRGKDSEERKRIRSALLALGIEPLEVFTVEELLALATQSEGSVIFCTPDIPSKTIKMLLEKIGSNGYLEKIFLVLPLKSSQEIDKKFHENDIFSSDLKTPEEIFVCHALGVRTLALNNAIRHKRRLEETLTSISQASHQLNQPLQVLLGKLDVFLLSQLGNGEVEATFSIMKKQVFRASDINQKIARLAKYPGP